MRFSSRIWSAVSLLIGLFAASYLLYVYVTHGPITCGLNGGCELVRASKWSHVGSIPLPLFGVLFYSGLFAVLVTRLATAWRAKELFWLMKLSAWIGFIESVYLFFVQWIEIKAFCTWCLTSALAATGLFISSWWDTSELTPEQRTSELNQLFLVMLGWVFLAVPSFILLTR